MIINEVISDIHLQSFRVVSNIHLQSFRVISDIHFIVKLQQKCSGNDMKDIHWLEGIFNLFICFSFLFFSMIVNECH
jgi:hypothetical protein